MTNSFIYICEIINLEESLKLRNTKINKTLGLSLLILVLGVGIPLVVIGQINHSENLDKNLIYATGEIVYLNFEGGFFGIISDDGKHYDPINLPSEFEVIGLRITIIAEKLDSGISYDEIKTFEGTMSLIDSKERIKKNLLDVLDLYGDRLKYVGPDCGLSGWHPPQVAYELLHRTYKVIKNFAHMRK